MHDYGWPLNDLLNFTKICSSPKNAIKKIFPYSCWNVYICHTQITMRSNRFGSLNLFHQIERQTSLMYTCCRLWFAHFRPSVAIFNQHWIVWKVVVELSVQTNKRMVLLDFDVDFFKDIITAWFSVDWKLLLLPHHTLSSNPKIVPIGFWYFS